MKGCCTLEQCCPARQLQHHAQVNRGVNNHRVALRLMPLPMLLLVLMRMLMLMVADAACTSLRSVSA
jgi:hypothetical protein